MTNNQTNLPKTIWILGFVSMFMDISSEMIHGFLPLFLINVMGATYVQVGLLDGLGSGLTVLLKVISGPLSDFLKHKKYLVFSGYLLGALSKPLFALAPNTTFVFITHLIDRSGKGIRGAPRDALIAEMTPPSLRGRAFGLRQSLDTLGAIIGPLLAILLMGIIGIENLRWIFWLALIPGLISVLLIVFGVEEPRSFLSQADPENGTDKRKPIKYGKLFWEACAIGAVVQLARLGDAFLILRAKDFNLAPANVPIVLIIMNLAYSMTAYPAGRYSDQYGRKKIIRVGAIFLFFANLILAFSSNLLLTFIGVGLWGIHYGLTQSNLIALVTDTCPEQARGTALGIFNVCLAGSMVISGVSAGYFWDHFGPTISFSIAAGATFLGQILMSRLAVEPLSQTEKKVS